MTRAVLSLGSNLGDRYQFLRGAVAGLGDAALVVSGVYETEPVYETGPAYEPGSSGEQEPPAERVPHYLNAAVLVADAGADPYHWLGLARELERAAGRQRPPGRRYAARTLDVDVIMVWDDAGEPVTSTEPELTLPHPRAHERAFVLRPWLDIQPYAQLPGYGPVTDLVRADPVGRDLARLHPRPDLPLEPDATLESGT